MALVTRLAHLSDQPPSLSRDLQDLGFSQVRDLRGEDPQALYDRLCRLRGIRVDPCVLYVFRCAVYFANQDEHDPELLKWWKWKDREGPGPGDAVSGKRRESGKAEE